MKTAITTLIVLVVLFSAGSAICAESESTDGRPCMGVLIDPAPLPGLLSKHLGLPVGQGLRIQNIQKDSPADKAGLERDDLIIGFQGQDVHDYEQFVEAIRDAGSGAEVSLQIIHLGSRKTVKLKLKPFEGEPDWKHPPEPQAVQSWRPGRFFRLEPGDGGWKELFKDGVPPDFDIDVKKFFNEVRTYHHSNGEDYSVTIQGNPYDEDSTVTVRVGDDKYQTTAEEIDKLPEKYREAAEKALENARKTSTRRKLDGEVDITWRRRPDWRGYFDKLNPRNYGPMPRFDGGEEIFDRIQKQMQEMRRRLEGRGIIYDNNRPQMMQEMRRRLEGLEERHGEILDRFSGSRDKKKSDEKEESPAPAGEDAQKAGGHV
jgi:hypothetical protein